MSGWETLLFLDLARTMEKHLSSSHTMVGKIKEIFTLIAVLVGDAIWKVSGNCVKLAKEKHLAAMVTDHSWLGNLR